jgi:hypothetical protein
MIGTELKDLDSTDAFTNCGLAPTIVAILIFLTVILSSLFDSGGRVPNGLSQISGFFRPSRAALLRLSFDHALPFITFVWSCTSGIFPFVFNSRIIHQNPEETPLPETDTREVMGMLPFRSTTGQMLLIMGFLLTFHTFASAANFFISPNGNDANAGTSTGAPWKTFAHAIPLLNPGDTLNLLDGIYTGSTTGYPNINCSSGAHNGTSSSPITIQAQNERQAWIKGDGSAEPFQLRSCSYWQVIGIHVSDIDFATQHEFDGTMAFYSSSNLLIRRNIVDHVNRCFNLTPLILLSVTNSIAEENEIYYFHRWGLANGGGSTGNEYRRNYINSRGYYFASNPTCTTYPGGGIPTTIDIGSYNNPGSNIFENNIGENSTGGDNAQNAENTTSNNQFLGGVELNPASSCYGTHPHSNSAVNNANSYVDDVCIHPKTSHFWFRGGTNITVRHGSMFGGTNTTYGGNAIMGVGLDPSETTNAQSVNTHDSQGVNLTAAADGAFYENSTAAPSTWTHDHDNNYNNMMSYNADTNVTNPLALNPAFGTCYLWVPTASPLKGAASDGGDIGATVLYQYNGGVLGTTPLWNSTTGAPLFAGATVASLNDQPGNSLFDIANRLNINTNGCSFPAGYGSGAVAVNPPTGLTVIVQ